MEIGNRLGGDSASAAVYRMQTEFGGGKTHTLLAAYHLFGSPGKVSRTALGRRVADELTTGHLPRARVAVLDGSALGVAPEPMPDGTVVHSYLGHLAWRLGGASMHAEVRANDEGRLGSSTVELVRLLERAAPCLILLDETLEYLNKALEVSAVDGNLAGTTLTVIKELCTAAANVPGAAIVATLTSSRLEDYSTVAGQEMFERLSKVVGAHREHRHARRGRRHLPDPAHPTVRNESATRRTGGPSPTPTGPTTSRWVTWCRSRTATPRIGTASPARTPSIPS